MSEGAGAKASWHAHSRQVFNDLKRLFGRDVVELVDFEVGEQARRAILASYEQHKARGAMFSEHFSDVRRLRLAVSREIAARMTGELYLFLQNSEQKGAYKASAPAVSRLVTELLEYDGSGFFVSSARGSAGVIVDYEPDGMANEPYELEAWSEP